MASYRTGPEKKTKKHTEYENTLMQVSMLCLTQKDARTKRFKAFGACRARKMNPPEDTFLGYRYHGVTWTKLGGSESQRPPGPF